MVGLLIAGCQGAYASPCTIPTIFATNGQVTSVNLNGDFSACQGTINGLLDNTNANTSAGYRFYQTVSSLPSAGNQGATYFLTTDNSLNLDNGSSFNKLLSPSGSPSQGNVVIYGASGMTYTGVGTSGQPLISQGAGANATFGNISAAGAVSGAALTSLGSTPSGAGIFPAANIGGLLGTWASRSFTTVYQAATDGFVTAYAVSSGGACQQEILTDSSSTPSTIRSYGSSDTNSLPATASSVVRKNDYYEVTGGGIGCGTGGTQYFIPIGS